MKRSSTYSARVYTRCRCCPCCGHEDGCIGVVDHASLPGMLSLEAAKDAVKHWTVENLEAHPNAEVEIYCVGPRGGITVVVERPVDGVTTAW